MKPVLAKERPIRIDTSARFEELASLFLHVAESEYAKSVEQAATLIGDAFEAGNKLLIFGNGGSSSDAQHLAGEMVVRFQTNRRSLPALALSADSAVLTACANDFGYSLVFARQIESLGGPGDVALGISTSGKSENVICALETARRQKLRTVLLTGASAPRMAEEWDLVLAVPSGTTARIQEVHLATYHLICEFIDQRFSGRDL
jgi:D-sedoheptulose 7-phosphate isomerase